MVASRSFSDDYRQPTFDYESYLAWLDYADIDYDTPYVFTTMGGNLVTTDASTASKARQAVWVAVNPVKEGSTHKKPAISDMAEIRNITLDFESPERPEDAHRVAKDFVDRLIIGKFAQPSQPIDNSGAGSHVIIPIDPIEMEDGDQEEWNKAVSRVVSKHFKPQFAAACVAQKVGQSKNMELGSFNIDRILSPAGTWRPTNAKKNDCDELKNGASRTWLHPYGKDHFPVRATNDQLRSLIIAEFEKGSEPTSYGSEKFKRDKVTQMRLGNEIRWLERYYKEKHTDDRSADFNMLVWACYKHYGEETTIALAEDINCLTGEKYTDRLQVEVVRSLKKAKDTIQFEEEKPVCLEVSDQDLCYFTADDAGNAEAMQALYGENILYCGTVGWLIYNKSYWLVDHDGAYVTQRAIDTLRKRRHAAVELSTEETSYDAIIKCTKSDVKRVKGCLEMLKAFVSVNIATFDADPDMLNCENGVVDLRTGEVFPHHYGQRYTYCLSVPYEYSDPSEWLNFLHGTVGGGDEMIDYLQLCSGYSSTGRTNEECLFYVFGPTRSGKGTFAEEMMCVLPDPISKGVDFNTFTAKREGDTSNFDLAPLKPARIIFASESNKSQSLNPAKIKSMTGNDMVTCCFKHKDFFSYRPQFKMWMLSNHPVNGDPDDDALWGRVRVIEFPNSFLGHEDKTIKARLKTTENLKGVLYWAVQGAIKWYALGAKGLTTPNCVNDATNRHRAELDYVQQWMDECATLEVGKWTASSRVMASYQEWCKDNNVQYSKGPRALMESLQKKGFKTGVQKKSQEETGGKNLKGVEGFSIAATDGLGIKDRMRYDATHGIFE